MLATCELFCVLSMTDTYPYLDYLLFLLPRSGILEVECLKVSK